MRELERKMNRRFTFFGLAARWEEGRTSWRRCWVGCEEDRKSQRDTLYNMGIHFHSYPWSMRLNSLLRKMNEAFFLTTRKMNECLRIRHVFCIFSLKEKKDDYTRKDSIHSEYFLGGMNYRNISMRLHDTGSGQSESQTFVFLSLLSISKIPKYHRSEQIREEEIYIKIMDRCKFPVFTLAHLQLLLTSNGKLNKHNIKMIWNFD